MINKEILLQKCCQLSDSAIKGVKMSVCYIPLTGFGYFVLLSALLAGCSSGQAIDAPLKRYYFPLHELEKEKIYTYKCEARDSLDDQLWVIRSEIRDGKTVMLGKIRQSDGTLTHQWREEECSTGVVMTDYSMSLNKDKAVSSKIIYDDVFPFRADKGGIFLFDMQWSDPANPGAKYELIRNRIYTGDTVLAVMGKRISCIHFKVRERIEVDQEGILGLDMNGDEYYGEGIGLVRFIRQIGDKRPVYTLASVRAL